MVFEAFEAVWEGFEVVSKEESGCRVHIERAMQEVRLYGPDESLKVAEKMLQEGSSDCFFHWNHCDSTSKRLSLDVQTPLRSHLNGSF